MKGFPDNDFKYPVVQTWGLIRMRFEQQFRENPDQEFIDAGEPLKFYQFSIGQVPKYDCREYVPEGENTYRARLEQIPGILKRHLTRVANAYKWRSEKNLWIFLERVGNLIRNERVIGHTVTDEELEVIIEYAIANKDTMEVEPNTTERVLENPYYCVDAEAASYNNAPDVHGNEIKIIKDWPIRREEKRLRKSAFTNQCLGAATKDQNYNAILTALYDYDLNQGLITRAKIADAVGVSEKTVKRYIQQHEALAEVFDSIKPHTKKRARPSITQKEKRDNRSLYVVKEEVSQKEVYGLVSLKPRQRPRMIDVIREHNKKLKEKASA